jgi:hypothetical protein
MSGVLLIDGSLAVVLQPGRFLSEPERPMSKGDLTMFRSGLGLVGMLMLLLIPYSSDAQQAEAPVYKNGDWWRVKLDVIRPAGVSVAGPVLERFSEYIVRFESNKPKVIGIQGNESKEIDSQAIVSLVLGRPGWLGDLLRFPIRIGLTWSERVKLQPPGMQLRSVEAKYEVQASEKIKTQKGEFDAFKVIMTMSVPRGPKPLAPAEVRTHTYYYAPDVKALASFHTSGSEASVASTLIDFGLAK